MKLTDGENSADKREYQINNIIKSDPANFHNYTQPMKPLISVIVPIYNTAKYLDKCLESVLQQTMSEIEIICVDDFSSDGSCLIVERYCKQDARIQLIRHKENKGSGGARNTGILAAKADFLASVDSDDYMNPEMMQTLWDASEDGKFDVVGCGYDCVDESGKKISSHNLHPKIFQNENDSINIFSVVNPAFWNKLWRKSLSTDDNIFFPEKLYYQDLATIPRLLSKSKKVKLISGNYYNYLIRAGSTTTSFSQKHITDYIKVFTLLFDFLNDNQLLEHYKYTFINAIDANIYNHVKNILKSDLNNQEQTLYLSQLYSAKELFLKTNLNIDRVPHDSVNNSPKTLTNKNKLVRLLMPANQLSSQQKAATRIVEIILKGFLSSSLQLKLKENPVGFFSDSKSNITRSIGRLFKII